MKFHKLVGLSGVAAHESAAAIRWGKRFEWPMLLVASWIFLQWYLEATGQLGQRFLRLSDWIVWLFFLLETVVLVSLVRDRRGYLVDNWMNVAIILAGLPILWHFTPLAGLVRNFRLVLMLALLAQFIPSVRQVLLRNHLGYTLLIAIVFTVVSGILISQVDPAISSIRGWDLVCLGDLDHRRLRGPRAQEHRGAPHRWGLDFLGGRLLLAHQRQHRGLPGASGCGEGGAQGRHPRP